MKIESLDLIDSIDETILKPASRFEFGRGVTLYEFELIGAYHTFKVVLHDWSCEPAPHTMTVSWIKPYLIDLIEFHDPTVTASCLVKHFFLDSTNRPMHLAINM